MRRSDYPCVTSGDARDHFLERCPEDLSKPQPLTERHCDEMFLDIKRSIEQYARKIQSTGEAFPPTRYPPEDTGLACLWDCGYESSDKSALHIGLNQEEIDRLVNKSMAFRTDCKKQVKDKLLCYLNPETAAAAGNTDELDRKLEESSVTNVITQEVCGEIVNAAGKAVSDFFGGLGDLVESDINSRHNNLICGVYEKSLYVGIPEDDLEYVKQLCYGGVSDGINEFTESFFSDKREIQNNRVYKCEVVKVMSSGNEVVDKVRSALSFNDIKVYCICVWSISWTFGGLFHRLHPLVIEQQLTLRTTLCHIR